MSTPSSPPEPDALTLVVMAIDEMHQTTALLPVAEASRSLNRSWWRNIGMLFARSVSGAEVGADNSLQYLAENVDRAQQHWREALSSLSELQRLHTDNEVVASLVEQLPNAGLNEVLPQLDVEAIPRGTAKAAVHLAAVVDIIHRCEHLAAGARNKLNLQRMRAD